MSEKLKMPVIIYPGNGNFQIQDGEMGFTLGTEGLGMYTSTVSFSIRRCKRDPLLDILLKNTGQSVSFRLNDIGCGSLEVEKPKDMPESIWTRFSEMYARFLPLYNVYIAEVWREESRRKQVIAEERKRTIEGIEVAFK